MKVSIQAYANTISRLTEKLEEIGSSVDPFFQELKKAGQLGTVDEMDQSRLKEIKKQFQVATDQYRALEKMVWNAKVPAKLIGKHQLLKRYLREYANQCQKMVDAVDDQTKKLDEVAFQESEHAQKAAMGQMTKALTKIMSSLMG
ncbi:hypothetical protein [Pediococcus acidilactici]|uniref:hypothetical protein n=1 Tax=Pediococcus acidilactici TaxID=1254 RepID=UPI00155F10CF|nr:hypothetical protein [Pediococcus acidilactici]NRD13881.1 hypothetical protein [Pediococcus acidilactici]